MNKLFTWLKGLAEGWKIFFGLIGMVTIIATAAIKLDHIKNKKVTNDVRIDKWIRYDSLAHIEDLEFRALIINNISKISDSIKTTNKSIRKLSKVNSNIKDWLIKNAATKDEVMGIYGIFDIEKKNSSAQTP